MSREPKTTTALSRVEKRGRKVVKRRAREAKTARGGDDKRREQLHIFQSRR